MIQDIRFKDAYPSETEWHMAILEVLKDKDLSIWFVFHE